MSSHPNIRIPVFAIKKARQERKIKALYAWALLKSMPQPEGWGSQQRLLTGPLLADLLGVTVKTAYVRIEQMKELRLLFKSKKIKYQYVINSNNDIHRSSCEYFGVDPEIARRVTKEEYRTMPFEKLKAKTCAVASFSKEEIKKGEKEFIASCDAIILEVNLLQQKFAQKKNRTGVSAVEDTSVHVPDGSLSGRVSCSKFGELTGCARSTASNRLRSLESKGLVDIHRKRVWIDQGLEEMAPEGVQAFFNAQGIEHYFPIPGGGFAANLANLYTIKSKVSSMKRARLKH